MREFTFPCPDPALEASIRWCYTVAMCYSRVTRCYILRTTQNRQQNLLGILDSHLPLIQLGDWFSVHHSYARHISTAPHGDQNSFLVPIFFNVSIFSISGLRTRQKSVQPLSDVNHLITVITKTSFRNFLWIPISSLKMAQTLCTKWWHTLWIFFPN